MSGILLLSHCGFSFIESLAASVRARGLRVLILTSRPADDTPNRVSQLREVADVVLEVHDRHDLVEQDVVSALETLRRMGETLIATLSVWEGYRRLMAQANASLGVRDLDVHTVDLLADKLRVRQTLQAAGATHVHAEPATDGALLAWLHEQRPGFVKPRRGIASYGAQRLRPGLTEHSLARLIEASRTDPVYGSLVGRSAFFIEDYVPGAEHSFEVLVVQGHAHLATVHEKLELTETESSVLEDACVSPPLGWDRKKHEAASAWVNMVLGALGAAWGCFHIEARLTPQGWELIEVNPRAGGALISQSSAAQHGGRSLLDQWLDVLLDQQGPDACRLQGALADQARGYPTGRAAFFRVFYAQPGLITGIKRNDMTRPPESLQCFLEPGTTVPAADREVFLGQALWTFEQQRSSDMVAHLLVESRSALEAEYAASSIDCREGNHGVF
jgi:biotin carboxylase